MENRRLMMVAEAVWKTICLAYQDPGDPRNLERVPIPTREAIGALLTCVAQIVATVPDAEERRRIIAMMPEAVGNAVRKGRNRPDLILPKNDAIVLPN